MPKPALSKKPNLETILQYTHAQTDSLLKQATSEIIDVLRGSILELHDKIDTVRDELRAEWRSDMQKLSDELRAEWRSDMQKLSDELRAEWRSDMQKLSDELRAEWRSDMQKLSDELRPERKSDMTNLIDEQTLELSAEILLMKEELQTGIAESRKTVALRLGEFENYYAMASKETVKVLKAQDAILRRHTLSIRELKGSR